MKVIKKQDIKEIEKFRDFCKEKGMEITFYPTGVIQISKALIFIGDSLFDINERKGEVSRNSPRNPTREIKGNSRILG